MVQWWGRYQQNYASMHLVIECSLFLVSAFSVRSHSLVVGIGSQLTAENILSTGDLAEKIHGFGQYVVVEPLSGSCRYPTSRRNSR